MAKEPKVVEAADPWEKWGSDTDARLAKIEQMLGLASPVEAKDDAASDPAEDAKAGE